LDTAKTAAYDIQQGKIDFSRIPMILKVQSEINNYLFGSSKIKNNPSVRQFISHLNTSGSPIIQNRKGHIE